MASIWADFAWRALPFELFVPLYLFLVASLFILMFNIFILGNSINEFQSKSGLVYLLVWKIVGKVIYLLSVSLLQ